MLIEFSVFAHKKNLLEMPSVSELLSSFSLVPLSLCVSLSCTAMGQANAADILGTESDSLIQYDGKKDQFINHQTGEIIPVVVDENGLRTIETTFTELIEGYGGDFGSWNEVFGVPYDKAVLTLEKGLKLTNGNAIWVTDTDAIVEMKFASGTQLYGELDPDIQRSYGLITPDNSTGLTIDAPDIYLKVLDSAKAMADDMAVISTRGNGWSPYFEPNSGTHINTNGLTIVSENTVSSTDKTAVRIYNNLFNLNAKVISIHGLKDDESTRFATGILSANSLTEIVANEIFVDAETAIVVQDPLVNGDPSRLAITADSITLNGSVQLYGSNLEFNPTTKRNAKILTITTDGTDAVTANTPDYPAKLKHQASLNVEMPALISSQGESREYADLSGHRTSSALRALRNSTFNLVNENARYEIYGDIIAGRGISTDDAGGVINIGGTGNVIRGDVLAGNTGRINISLKNADYEGRVDDYHDAGLSSGQSIVFRPEEFDIDVTESGVVNLEIGNSVWTARHRNFVTSIKFAGENSDSNIIDMSLDENSSLSVQELSGSGKIRMRVSDAIADDGAHVTDMLYVGKLDENAHINIELDTSAFDHYDDLNGLRFATTVGDFFSDGNDKTLFSARIEDHGFFNRNLTIYTEKYSSDEVSENVSYNGQNDGSEDNESAGGKPGQDYVDEIFGETVSTNWYFGEQKDPVTPPSDISDAGETILGTARATYWNAVILDRWNQRYGERTYDANKSGVWARVKHERLGTDSGVGDFRSYNTMYQFGYDYAKPTENGKMIWGAAFDYMDGRTDYKSIEGDGGTDRTELSLYATYLGDNGFYGDLVIRGGKLNSDFDMVTPSGTALDADYDNWFYGVSFETGRQLENDTGWFVEPQAQMQYLRIASGDYSTAQTEVEQDAIDSLIGRAGFRVGKFLSDDKAQTVYFKADVLREFMGEQKIRVTDVTTRVGGEDVSISNRGTWFDVGAGFQAAVSKDFYAYGDVEYRFGNDLWNTWVFNVGAKYRF